MQQASWEKFDRLLAMREDLGDDNGQDGSKNHPTPGHTTARGGPLSIGVGLLVGLHLLLVLLTLVSLTQGTRLHTKTTH